MIRFYAAIAAGVALSTIAGSAQAEAVASTDLDTLARGGTIVGPVGPTVNASILSERGEAVADIVGQVDCPAGIDPCQPAEAPEGTIYTFIYRVTPGADSTNDAPFQPNAPVTMADGVTLFGLDFIPPGFTGVAGYSFSDVAAALDGRAEEANGLMSIDVDEAAGRMVWATDAEQGWDRGETITFFFQTTQPPKGPGEGFLLEAGSVGGSGHGPVPRAIESE
ncbi:MAG: exosortase, PEP-CTERM interaction domain protein [Pseudomonadota bacterium]